MSAAKPRLSFSQIINMNVGFFGIQYSFGLQQSAINPIYDMLGAEPHQIPILNLAGPVTGLIVQPIIGAMSDKTWHPKLGRRKPYFLVGAILCSLALLIYPFSSSLWMAAGLLWILDAGNNTAMEPYRAFIADNLNEDQQPTGFQTQSFFTGLGQTLANLSLFFFPFIFIGYSGSLPNWVYASFFLGAACSIGTILWSMYTTKEIEPTAEELAAIKNKKAFGFSTFKEIYEAIINMPRVLKQLALVYLFQWYALFCYWQNAAKSVGLSVWGVTAKSNERVYEEAVSWTGLVNGWYNIVTFLTAFVLVGFAKKYSAKWVHFTCLLLAAVGFLAFPYISNKYLLLVAITGFGVGWASMMGIPYLMVVSSIPKEKYGVYMGIINMMIVVPMIIQNLTFGFILEHFFADNARLAIVFAGVLLVLAAIATAFIKVDNNPIDEKAVRVSAGH